MPTFSEAAIVPTTMVRLLLPVSIPNLYLRCQYHKLDHESSSAVQFTLSSESAHNIVYILPHGQGYLNRQQVPITGSPVHIDELPLDHSSIEYSLISDKLLSRLPIDHKAAPVWMARQICSNAKALIDNATRSFSEVGNNNQLWLIDVKIEVLSVVELEESERADYEMFMRSSGVGFNNGMIPATWSSIACLEQVIFYNGGSSDERSSCAICLGDLPMASYVTRMPCLHVFHGKCIVKWLADSHYCPICRFKMPN